MKRTVKPLTSEQRKLIEDYLAEYEHQMYLCIHKNAKRKISDEEFEELRSVAYMALCKAARNYKPNRNTKFASFAFLNVSSAMKSHFNKDNALKRLVYKLSKSLDEPIDSTDKVFLKDVIASTDGIEIYETSLRVVQYLHKIPKTAKQILHFRCYYGWDYIKIKEHLRLDNKTMREMLLRIQEHDYVKILKRDERVKK